jgi:hypothetical protein
MIRMPIVQAGIPGRGLLGTPPAGGASSAAIPAAGIPAAGGVPLTSSVLLVSSGGLICSSLIDSHHFDHSDQEKPSMNIMP